MGVNVFDTSALGKRYHPETGTAKVDELFSDSADVHAISRFAAVEIHSVFAKKVRTGSLSPSDLQILIRQFRSDVAAKRIRVIRLLVAHFRLAEQLLSRHASVRNLRTLDALQLAVAIRMNAASPIRFICSDQALCQIAVLESLEVVNPEIECG